MQFDDADEKMTRDEIAYMLSNSEETLGAEEIEMLQGVFSLDELMAREVMVPRTDSFMIDINDDTQDNIQEILKQNFSRIPVYDDDKDKIIGILHTKRLLAAGFAMDLTKWLCVRFYKNLCLFQKLSLWMICCVNCVIPKIKWLSC